MASPRFIDLFPLWVVFLATVAIVMGAIETGFRLGVYRRTLAAQEDRPPVGEIVAATLALLAFLLAFTFGLAASRFELRRDLIVEEANAIGTTFLRTDFLTEPDRQSARKLLRQYVDARLIACDQSTLAAGIKRSEEIHKSLWSLAAAAGQNRPDSVATGLFIASLNEVIDLHTKRMALGLRNRIPEVIWAALYFLAAIGTSVIGYHTGLSGSGRSPASIALILAFTAVIVLIVDLDRPQEGLLRVSQQALIDLQTTIKPVTPPAG